MSAEEVRKLDVEKCFAEIGQLQSQQFWLVNFAITAFGLFLNSIAKEFLTGTKDSTDAYVFESFALYAILFLLFRWFLQMRWQIAFVSVWIEKEGQSIWEQDAHHFSEMRKKRPRTGHWKKHRKISGTRFASSIFLALGLLWPALFVFEIWHKHLWHDVMRREYIAPAIVSICYCVAVAWSGIYYPKPHRSDLHKQWDDVRPKERA